MATRPMGLWFPFVHTTARAPQKQRAVAKVSSQHVIGLDALRIFASLIVLVFHFDLICVQASGVGLLRNHLFALFHAGWVGVQIFFVVSGFVISYSIEEQSAADFIQRRVSRLWPAMLLCATLCAGLRFLDHRNESVINIVNSWRHSIFFQSSFDYIDMAHWTLPVEVQFYALIFLILLFGKSKKLARILTIGGVVSSLYCVLLLLSNQATFHLMRRPLLAFGFLLSEHPNLLRYGCFFYLGVCLHLMSKVGMTRKNLILAAIPCLGGICEIVTRCYELRYSKSYAWQILWWSSSIVFIVLSVRKNDLWKSKLNLKAAALLRRFGLMTYSIYLMHMSVAEFMLYLVGKRIGIRPALSMSLLVVLVLSYFISAYLESPMAKWLQLRLVGAPESGDAAQDAAIEANGAMAPVFAG